MILFDINFQETKCCNFRIFLPENENYLEVCLGAYNNTFDFSYFATNLNTLVD
jgi:hypothetical protein